MPINDPVEVEVRQFCVDISNDRAWVQAAGGNVSWKTDTELWIKASGMWLADAKKKPIFVSINLGLVNAALNCGNYSYIPEALNGRKNRPSIETLLHALMPQKIVVHLHLVDLVARLIRKDWKKDIQSVLGDSPGYAFVDYHKPGAELAKRVHLELKKNKNVEIIFLQNHGLVVGAENIEDIRRLINNLLTKTKVSPMRIKSKKVNWTNIEDLIIDTEYRVCSDMLINQLIVQPNLYNSLRENWAICPDHVVFLGAEATCVENMGELKNQLKNSTSIPFIFYKNRCVLENKRITRAQKSQLIFYTDVMLRNRNCKNINCLNFDQNSSLINWDAEIFRKNINLI